MYYLLVHVLSINLSEAAKYISIVLGRTDRTVRSWRATFLVNEGTFPDTLQGKYRRTGVLWHNEELNKVATAYVRQNAASKGRRNLRLPMFCKWVNETLLLNETLEPGYPRKISMETARLWLHELGFSVVNAKKGTYVD